MFADPVNESVRHFQAQGGEVGDRRHFQKDSGQILPPDGGEGWAIRIGGLDVVDDADVPGQVEQLVHCLPPGGVHFPVGEAGQLLFLHQGVHGPHGEIGQGGPVAFPLLGVFEDQQEPVQGQPVGQGRLVEIGFQGPH